MVTVALPRQIAHYQLLQVLGRGGMGVVYLGEDKRLQRRVAVKCLHSELADERTTERLQREARLLAQINHPNIVQVYEFIDGPEKALVMELVQGRNLRQYLREQQCSRQQQLQILVQIAEALAAAHAKGVVHRDLKLDNVLISERGQLKLTDFGVALEEQADELSLSGEDEVSGSFNAMSPEQIKGEAVGPPSDLFAFGLLAYQVLGAPHPLGDSSSQLLMLERTLKAEPSELSASWAEAPAALNQLLLQLLQKDPAQRPANATAVAAQLRQLLPQMGTELSGEITQFEHSLALPQLKSARPWPKILAATGLAGAALAVLLWLWPLLNPFASPGLRVAVLPTQMESQSADDYELLRATVQQALQHGVDRQQKLHLVSPAELAAAGSADNIGTIVAADVVVTSQLNCHQDRCQLQLSRLMGSRWSVNGQVRTTLLHSSLFGAYNAVLVHTGKLFAERNSNVDQVNTISAEDYQRFAELRLRHQPGAKAAELIEPLEAILLKAPRFEPLYQFYTELVLASSAEPSPPLVDGLRRALDTAESLLPQSIPLQRHWFDLHLRLGELEAQQQRLQKLIDLGLPTAAVLSLRAQIALRNGDYQAAVGLYRQLLRQHKSVANYRALAHSLWTIGSGDEAKQLLQQALVLAPEHSQLLNMLGAVHLTLGELDQAVEQFQKHRRLQRDSRVESNLGLAYLLQRKYFKAQQAFAAALVLEPSNSALRLNLADSYLLLGQTEKAEQYYNNFLTQSNEQDWQAWLQRSQAYIHTGATIEALKAAEQAQVLAPGNNQVAFSSALTYSLAGNYPATLLWVEKSLDLGIAPVWFRLPWFDQLCSDTKFGPEFGKLVARSCGPLSGA